MRARCDAIAAQTYARHSSPHLGLEPWTAAEPSAYPWGLVAPHAVVAVDLMLPLCRWLHLNDLEHVTTRGAMALATALRSSALASLEVLWMCGEFSRHFFEPDMWPHDPAHDAELLAAEDYESVPFGGVAALAGACDARRIVLEVRRVCASLACGQRRSSCPLPDRLAHRPIALPTARSPCPQPDCLVLCSCACMWTPLFCKRRLACAPFPSHSPHPRGHVRLFDCLIVYSG